MHVDIDMMASNPHCDAACIRTCSNLPVGQQRRVLRGYALRLERTRSTSRIPHSKWSSQELRKRCRHCSESTTADKGLWVELAYPSPSSHVQLVVLALTAR